METFVNYGMIELRCEYEIEEYCPATYLQPEEGGNIYDLCIYVDSQEISQLLSDDKIESIKELIIEQL
jgi:hypothetical protein